MLEINRTQENWGQRTYEGQQHEQKRQIQTTKNTQKQDFLSSAIQQILIYTNNIISWCVYLHAPHCVPR